MKKSLLIICQLISFLCFSQINTQVTNYAVCDSNNDGIAAFDLTTKVGEILNNLNPAIHTTTFHETMTDAQVGVNPITNPTAYTNISSWNQTLYVRVVNTQTSEVSVTSFQLVVNPAPTANPGSLFFCDPNELVIYNLNMSIQQITGGLPSSTVTFYLTLADAQNNVAPVNGDFFVPTAQPVQVLFARVQNNTTGCFAITTLTLNTNNCTPPVCSAPTNLTVTGISGTSAVLGWTTQVPGVSQILAVPYGSPAPTAATTGWTAAPTNPFIVTGLSTEICYSFYVRNVCGPNSGGASAWTGPANFCVVNCSNNATCTENLELIAFIDTNNNSIKDSGESNFYNGSFVYTINSGSPIYASSNNGNFFIFENNPANSYNLSYSVNAGLGSYFSSLSTYTNVTVPTGSGNNVRYFPITQLQPYNDIEVHIVPNGNPRPGFDYSNVIYYKNKCNQIVNSGTVTFTKSPAISINSISQSGTTATATGFTYDFSNLAPSETRSMTVSLHVPTIPTVSLGQIVTNSATIVPIAGDAAPLDNNFSISQTIIGSYDPNDKMEAHGGRIDIDEFSSTDYLTYTIRFENTGTANAEFIRVEDTLNGELNAASVVILNSSHSVDVRRINNKLIWNFYNIQLPPTVNNPNASHGFVQFKVKPNPGYAIGTIIPNKAEIYFDYNPPIVTNIFQTEFVENLGNPSFSSANFILFPNPSHDFFQVGMQNSNENIKNISITDVVGKTVKILKNINTTATNVDVSDLSNGIYLVEITTENNLKMTKKLVVN